MQWVPRICELDLAAVGQAVLWGFPLANRPSISGKWPVLDLLMLYNCCDSILSEKTTRRYCKNGNAMSWRQSGR